MHLHYWRATRGNFGDDLNPWLWNALIPELPQLANDVVFFGVGSILGGDVPKGRVNVVFGSGAGYGSFPADRKWKFYAVRGPRTAKVFGCEDVAFGDPAILVPLLRPVPRERQNDVIFVPHWESAVLGGWAKPCRDAGVTYVDPRRPYLEVIDAIAGARLVIAESMHAAIIADAYRVPWIPVVCGHSNEFKWMDWADSLGLEYQPRAIDSETQAILQRGAFSSADELVRRLRHQARRKEPRRVIAAVLNELINLQKKITVLNRRSTRSRRTSSLRMIVEEVRPNLSDEGALKALQEGLLRQIDLFQLEWSDGNRTNDQAIGV